MIIQSEKILVIINELQFFVKELNLNNYGKFL